MMSVLPESVEVKALLAEAKLHSGDVAGAQQILEELYPQLESSFLPDNDNYRNLNELCVDLKRQVTE